MTKILVVSFALLMSSVTAFASEVSGGLSACVMLYVKQGETVSVIPFEHIEGTNSPKIYEARDEGAIARIFYADGSPFQIGTSTVENEAFPQQLQRQSKEYAARLRKEIEGLKEDAEQTEKSIEFFRKHKVDEATIAQKKQKLAEIKRRIAEVGTENFERRREAKDEQTWLWLIQVKTYAGPAYGRGHSSPPPDFLREELSKLNDENSLISYLTESVSPTFRGGNLIFHTSPPDEDKNQDKVLIQCGSLF